MTEWLTRRFSFSFCSFGICNTTFNFPCRSTSTAQHFTGDWRVELKISRHKLFLTRTKVLLLNIILLTECNVFCMQQELSWIYSWYFSRYIFIWKYKLQDIMVRTSWVLDTPKQPRIFYITHVPFCCLILQMYNNPETNS